MSTSPGIVDYINRGQAAVRRRAMNDKLAASTSKSDVASEIALTIRRMPAGECSYCDKWGNDPMMPRHTASASCESGKHNHCTCDSCF